MSCWHAVLPGAPRLDGCGMTGIELRPATRADSEFCFRLHKAAMGGYITAIWGWDEQCQRGFHASGFDPDRWQIVTADGPRRAAGTKCTLGKLSKHPEVAGLRHQELAGRVVSSW